MAWEMIKTTGKAGLRIGTFSIRTITNAIILPEFLRGQNFTWYFDAKAQIAKIEFSKNGIRHAVTSISIPQIVKEYFKEEQTITYVTENAIYFSSYKKGQEYLERFLKTEGVI